MMKILLSSQIKEIEALADNNGISYLRLMENAGSACAKVIRNEFDDSGLRNVTIVCGKGKNGGDGFVIARKLFENGYKVNVLLALGEPVADNAVEMYTRLVKLGVDVEIFDMDNRNQVDRIEKSDIIVDCIFGTGFSGAPDDSLSKLFRLISDSRGVVISVDLPSGLCADECTVAGEVVRADITISIIALKYSLVYYPSASFAGEIKVVSIGVPEELIMRFDGGFSLNANDIRARFTKRNSNANKGNFGKGLIIAGSYEMPGAALLSSSAAIECGAGIVKLAFPDKAYAAMMSVTPEKVLVPLPSNHFGRISAAACNRVISEVKSCTCVLLGCGMGNDCDTKTVVKAVLENSEIPVIIDADGINAISSDIDIIKNSPSPVVITPHPGEAARLLGCEIKEIEKDRMSAAKLLYQKTGAVVVLKGARTVVTANGRDFYINLTGNAGMATGGSGDVLGGMILSFICQGMKPFSAAVSAVYLHGLAGDNVASKFSMCGTTPSKIIAELAKTLSSFEKG